MPKEKKVKKAAPAPKYYPGDDLPAKAAKQTNGVSITTCTAPPEKCVVSSPFAESHRPAHRSAPSTADEVAIFHHPGHHSHPPHRPLPWEAVRFSEAASFRTPPCYRYVSATSFGFLLCGERSGNKRRAGGRRFQGKIKQRAATVRFFSATTTAGHGCWRIRTVCLGFRAANERGDGSGVGTIGGENSDGRRPARQARLSLRPSPVRPPTSKSDDQN